MPSISYQRFIPAIFTILVVFFGSLFFFLKGENKSLSVKFFIIYSVCTLLLFAIIACETFFNFESPTTIYLVNMGVFSCIGILHTYLVRNYMGLEENESFLPELIFTFYVTMLGAAIYTFLFGWLHDGKNASYSLIFASSIILVFIPFLFYRSFVFLVAIPAPIFKKWYYPVGDDVEIAEEEYADDRIRVLKLEVVHSLSSPENIATSKIKGPIRVELGKVFAYFISYWNDEQPGNQIDFVDEYSQAYGWNFYLKPKWYSGTVYLDPDLTVAENDLKDGDVIIAERVID